MVGLHQWLITRTLPMVPAPILWRFSRRYIAGPTLDDASRIVGDLNHLGCCATLDVLGEYVKDAEETRRNADLYQDALARIDQDGLDSNISLKLSAMGQTLDEDLCEENAREVLEAADRFGSFVRFDMEDSTTVDSTLSLYRTLRKDGIHHVGVCLQSRLRRSLQDVRDLAEWKPNYRLCKGIYLEPPDVAYQNKEEVDAEYLALLEAMLEGGSYVGIATHDPYIIHEAERLVAQRNLDPGQYEFQMLLGVAEPLRRNLVEKGHKVRVYVPYGRQWRAYSLRRLKENPELVGHIIRNLFSRR